MKPTQYIAFLRAINVGNRRVKKEELCKPIETLGFTNVDTFLASGNVLLCSFQDCHETTKQLELSLGGALGYTVQAFLKTPQELKLIATQQPTEQVKHTIVSSNIMFLRAPLKPEESLILSSLCDNNNTLIVENSVIYWYSSTQMSQSTVSPSDIEKKLKQITTVRNINTISRLAAKFP